MQGLDRDLEALKDRDLYRTRRELNSPQGPVLEIDGRKVLNFCSNDYLGLANDRRLITALQQAAEQHGVGSGASPLVCGRSSVHADLEQELARFTGRDRALVFSSGYLANLSLVTSFCPGRDDLIVLDRLCHASLVDGALLARGTLKRYPHKDVGALNTMLGRSSAKVKLVLTDGVFSMDGDIAPVMDIVDACKTNQAGLALDDAHGFGVLGETGRGTPELFNLGQEEIPLLMATFGKALGVFGAFIAGADTLIEILVQRARPYIYSTALPPAAAATALTALAILREEAWRRSALKRLIQQFRNGAMQLGLPLLPSETPIQPLILGAASRALEVSERLFKLGILITAIRPPTVPEHTSRLRISITATHTGQHIDQLLDALVTAVT